MAWLLPTGNVDSQSKWTNETSAYDGNTGTYASSATVYPLTWSSFIEFTHAAMSCSKVRFNGFYCSGSITVIDVDVYYGGAWHDVYEGSFPYKEWLEKSLSSIQTITAFRFRFYNSHAVNEDYESLYEVNFYELGLPTVTTTSPVEDILSTTATSKGNITVTGGENATKRGICYNTTGSPTVADSKVEETGSFGTGAFTSALTGLLPGTTYHCKAYAYNSAGYGYGAEVDFTTLTPTVTSQAVSAITHNTATGNGNITVTGGANATKRGICYSTSTNPTVADSKVEEIGSFGTGAFTEALTGLSPYITYHAKAYIYSFGNYYYGAEVDFTTLKTTPTVTVQAPTDVLPTTVTANGNITASGGENATVRGFKYGLTQTDTWDAHDGPGSYEAGAYTKGLTGLSANTTYWVRAYATNSIGTSYSEWIQFQTAAVGIIPTGTKLNICSDYSGYSYKLMRAETDDGEAYTAYFVISTDLSNKQALAFYKRILDLHLYFKSEDSGTATIEVKRDNEAEWQTVGSVSLTGTADIIVKHLACRIYGKHFLFKISAANYFRFLGCLFQFVPGGMR